MTDKIKYGDVGNGYYKYLTLLLGSSTLCYRTFYLILAIFYSEHRIWGKQRGTKCTGSVNNFIYVKLANGGCCHCCFFCGCSK